MERIPDLRLAPSPGVLAKQTSHSERVIERIQPGRKPKNAELRFPRRDDEGDEEADLVAEPPGQSPSSCGKLKWVVRHARGAT